MTRAIIAATLAACTVCYLAGRNIEQARVLAWRDNAQYAARLAVAYCRTDSECEHAASVADDYGTWEQAGIASEYLAHATDWE